MKVNFQTDLLTQYRKKGLRYAGEAIMELENVLKLIDAVSASKLTSFTLDDGSVKLSFEAERNEGNTFRIQTDTVNAQIAGNAAVTGQMAAGVEIARGTAGAETEASNAAESGQQVISGNVVKSPLVGIFYNAASPDEEPFIKVGDSVKKGQVLGIVEAMKLMNEIESEFDGVVKQILVDNEQMVEFGQPMFVIE